MGDSPRDRNPCEIPDSSFLILRSRRLNRRVGLNVGGVRHEALWRILESVPDSRLGRLASAITHHQLMDVCSQYSLMDNE